MKIQPIGEQLKKFRLERKKTLAFVASKIDATSSYVSQLEHGVRNPSDSVLFEILTKAYNLDDQSAEKLIRSWRIKQYTSSDVENMRDSASSVLLPLYRDIKVSVDSSKPAEMRSFYLDPSLLASDYFLWEMNDDSMQPLIPENTLILLNKDISEIPYHALILTEIAGSLTIRYYEKQPDRIKLIADNNNFPVFFGKEIPIFGIVKQMLINL